MSQIPAAGFPSNASRTQADMQTYLETMLSITKEQLGGTSEAASVQLASNTFTPGNNACVCPIDTNGLAPSDTLNTIQTTNIRDGEVIYLRSTSDSRVVTITNGASGAGQIFTQDGNPIVLDDTRQFVALKYNAAITAFEELFRTTPPALPAQTTLSNYYGDGSDGAAIISSPTTVGDDTTDSGLVVMQYTSLHVTDAGALTTAAQAQALLIYTQGDCTIDSGGLLHMNGKGAAGTASLVQIKKLQNTFDSGDTFSTENGNQSVGVVPTAFQSVVAGGAAGTAGAVGSATVAGKVGGTGGTIADGTGGGGGGGGATGTAPEGAAAGAAGTAFCGGSAGGGGGGGAAATESGGAAAGAGAADGGAGGKGGTGRHSSTGANLGGGGGAGAGNPSGVPGPGNNNTVGANPSGGAAGIFPVSAGSSTNGATHRQGMISVGQYVYHANGTNIEVWDPKTASLVQTIAIGAAQAIIASSDGSKIYCKTNSGGVASLQIIDTSSNTVIGTIDGGTLASGFFYVLSSDGSTLYVTDGQSPSHIDKYNLSGSAFVATVTLSGQLGSGDDVFVISSDGSKLFCPNFSTSGVDVVITATMTIATTIPLTGVTSSWCCAAANGNLYVGDAANSNIAVINMSTNTQTTSLTVGTSQRIGGMRAKADGTMIYGFTDTAYLFWTINTTANTITSVSTQDNIGINGMVLSDDESTAYLFCEGSGTFPNSSPGGVWTQDISAGTGLFTVSAGQFFHGVISPDGQGLFVNGAIYTNSGGTLFSPYRYQFNTGGGGTLIIVCGGTLTVNGLILANGADGGAGAPGKGTDASGAGGGGGGAGGGRIIALYKIAIVGAANIQANGGNGGPGALSGTGIASGAGGPGGAGAVTTAQIL
jgi:hypothetical protein